MAMLLTDDHAFADSGSNHQMIDCSGIETVPLSSDPIVIGIMSIEYLEKPLTNFKESLCLTR